MKKKTTDRDELLLLALVEALVTPSGKKSLDDIKRVSHWGWFVFSESEQGVEFWNSITLLTY